MNNKIIALIMAVAMAAVGLAVGLGNMTQADEAGQSVADPVWIIGDADTAYLVKAGEEIKIKDTVYPIIDFNLKAFDNPTLMVSVAQAAEIVDDEEDLDYTWVPVGTPGTGQSTSYEGDVLDAASNIIADDSDSAADGVYNVKLKAASGDDVPQDEDVYYYIKVDVTRNDPEDDVKFNPETVSLYYAAHIMVTDKTYENSVVLSTSVEAFSDADIETCVVGNDTFQYLEFQQDVSFTGIYAWVEQVLSGDDQVPTYNNADYDFYAKDLPVGIAMKLDGEISGKLSASVSVTQEDEYGSFSVYAVDKATGDGIYLGAFKYIVAPAEGFTYEVDGITYSWADPAYMVVKNTEEIEVTISDIGVNVYITKEGEEPELLTTTEEVDQKVTIGDLDDYTGILQIQLEQVADDNSSIHTAIVHVLVLGPVVHSGLLPTATSS